jgi:hypothetical protein
MVHIAGQQMEAFRRIQGEYSSSYVMYAGLLLLQWMIPSMALTALHCTGANLQLKLSPGRPPLLKEAEATLNDFEHQIKSLRVARFSLSLATLRSFLISLLLRDQHQDLISEHIYKDVAADFVPDKTKFFASDDWMLSFLHNRM